MLTLIDRFRMFARAASADDRIGSHEIAAYIMLLNIDNDLLFQEWFGCSDRHLQEMIQVGSVHTITKTKNRLKQLGWIDFKTAGKKTTLYKLTVPATATECATEYATGDSLTATERATERATDTATDGATDGATLIRQDKRRQDRQDKREKDVVFSRARELPQIPAEVKSAFEGVFHPLAGLKDMERLSCLLDEFGRRGVLFVIAQAKERPQGLERIRDPFSWMRKVLLTEPSPSSRAAGAGQAAAGGERTRPPDMTHVTAEEYARQLAEADKERYERSGGDIYGIFGGSQHALKP